MVLDAGDGVSHAVPVYEGFAIPSSIRRIDVAGRDVTEHLQTLLRKSGYIFHTSAEKEVVRAIKEKSSYVALDPRKEEKEWITTGGRQEAKFVDYTLPDGQKIKVGRELFVRSQVSILTGYRLDLNVLELQRSCSTRRSLDSSTPVSTKLW